MEEFFKQGEKEKELGLPCSPLCDRENTLIAESQIGKYLWCYLLFFYYGNFFSRFYSIYCWTIIYCYGRHARKSSQISQRYWISTSITIDCREKQRFISITYTISISRIIQWLQSWPTGVREDYECLIIIKKDFALDPKSNYQHRWPHLYLDQCLFEGPGRNFLKEIENDG